MKPKLHPKSGSALPQTSSLLIPTLFICKTLATFSRVEFKRTVSKFTKRVDKKKKKIVFLWSRPQQNVKLGSFKSQLCDDVKEMHLYSCFFANLNLWGVFTRVASIYANLLQQKEAFA